MLLVGVVAMALAATGTFGWLLAIAIALVLAVDSIAIGSLFVLRARRPDAPFRVPLYPFVPAAFITVYIALFVGAALAQPVVVAIGTGVLGAAYGLSWLTRGTAVTSPVGTESRLPFRE